MKYNCKDIYDNPENYAELLYQSGYLIYLITNEINNKHYVGDTTVNLHYRLFFDKHWKGHFIRYKESILNPGGSHGHLYNSMRKYGLENFSIEILYQGDYDENLEGYYIVLYDSFYNGYNGSLSGKPFNKESNALGKIRITDGTNEKLIKESEFYYYSELGWTRGRSNIATSKMMATQLASGEFRLFQSLGTEASRSESSKRKRLESLRNNPNYESICRTRVELMHSKSAIEKSKLVKKLNGTDQCKHLHTQEIHDKVNKTLMDKYGSLNGMMMTPEAQAKTNIKYKWLRPDGTYYIGRTKSASLMMNKRSESWTKLGVASEDDINKYSKHKIDSGIKQSKFLWKLPDGSTVIRAKPSTISRNHPDWVLIGPYDQKDLDN